MHSLEVLQARNFQKITLQRIFDAGWQAFVVEGKPWAADKWGSCSYDDGAGNCCAVGLCIPPNHDVRKNNRLIPASQVRAEYPDLFDAPESNEVLDYLQRKLHDDLTNKALIPGSPEVRAAYIAAAQEFGLKVPE